MKEQEYYAVSCYSVPVANRTLKTHTGLVLLHYHLPFPKCALTDATETAKPLLHKVSPTNDSLNSSEARKPFFRPGRNFSAQRQLRTLSSTETPIRAGPGKTKAVSPHTTELTGAEGSADPRPLAREGAGDTRAGQSRAEHIPPLRRSASPRAHSGSRRRPTTRGREPREPAAPPRGMTQEAAAAVRDRHTRDRL